MKKRLLSAALALAMVLTLLPLSALPVSAATTLPSGAVAYATFQATNNANNDYSGAPGWFQRNDATDANGKPTYTYTKITSGIVIGNYLYNSVPLDVNTNKPLSTANGTITAFGGVTVNVGDATSATVEVYGNSTQGYTGTVSIIGNSLNTLTVKDGKYQTEVNKTRKVGDRGSVSITAPSLTTLTLENVDASGSDVTLQSVTVRTSGTTTTTQSLTHTLNLTNAKIGAVTMIGNNGDTGNMAQNIKTTGSSTAGSPYDNGIKSITVTGNSSNINLIDTEVAGDIKITGTGISLTASGNTKQTSGSVILTGSDDEKVTTGSAPRVTVSGGAKLGDITQGTENLTGNYTIGVQTGSEVGAITIDNAAVTITGGTSGAITMKNGSLSLQTSATVKGEINFKDGGTITRFAVSGGNNTVTGAIKALGKTTFTTVDIADDLSNTFKSIDLGESYSGHGVKGGSFTDEHPIPQDRETGHLATTLAYRVHLENGKWAYFAEGKLGEAIAAAGKANAIVSGNIVVKGQTDSYNIILKSGNNTTVAKIGFNKAPTSIYLPKVVNGVTYDNWTLLNDSGTEFTTTYKGGAEFTRSKLADATLDAQESTGVVSKLTNVSIKQADNDDNKNVTVKLVGNVITLSGAATPNGSGAGFTLTLTTDHMDDDGTPTTIDVTVNWNVNTKKATFAKDIPVGYGITFPDENTMRLDNGTTYTVSGTGLVQLVTSFTTDRTSEEIVAAVTAPGYTTTAAKNALIKEVLGMDENGKVTSKFNWLASPAVRQAVNAAMATITDSQVTNWVTTAQRQDWSKTHTGTAQAQDLVDTGYTDVYLVPYLYVTITKANPITMTLVPYYRVEVRNSINSSKAPIVVKQGTSLGVLLPDLTGTDEADVGVQLTLDGTAGNNNNYYAHQDDTYVYKVDTATKKMRISYAGRTGLGTLVFNSTAPMVSLMQDKVESYFDSLQAAVDATKPQASGSEDVITVYGHYTGSGVISVTGEARTFKITTQGNTTITASTSNTSVSSPDSGHTYTIQLLRSNVTTTSIVVNSALNGTAAASAATAKPGDTITVTVRPNAGYVGSISVKTSTGATVPVTNKGNNTFTFTVPAGAVRVEVTPVFTLTGTVPPATSTLPFTDVSTNASYYTAVEYCYTHNLIQGTTVSTFSPNSTITRAQIVTILWRQAGAPVQAREGIYKDMPGNSDYYNAVIWATKNGIATGYEDGKFYPERPINRQELATFLYRYQTNFLNRGTAGSVSNLNGYVDGGNTGAWAQAAMRWAVGNGIVTGTSTSLTPTNAAPRYQAATAMYQYCSGVLGIR